MSKLTLLVVFSFASATCLFTLKVSGMDFLLTTGVNQENRNVFDYLGEGPDNPLFQHYYNVKPNVKQ